MLHHAIVMPLFCIMLEVDATNVWIAASLITLVHMPMYYYYLITASGGRPPAAAAAAVRVQRGAG